MGFQEVRLNHPPCFDLSDNRPGLRPAPRGLPARLLELHGRDRRYLRAHLFLPHHRVSRENFETVKDEPLKFKYHP